MSIVYAQAPGDSTLVIITSPWFLHYDSVVISTSLWFLRYKYYIFIPLWFFVITTSLQLLRYGYFIIVPSLSLPHHDSFTIPSLQLLHCDSFVIMTVHITPVLVFSPPCLHCAARNRESAAGKRQPTVIQVFVWDSFAKRRTWSRVTLRGKVRESEGRWRNVRERAAK